MTVQREHDADREMGDICPHCGEQGFDGHGKFKVGDMVMYRKQCWNCGTVFAVERPEMRG